MRPREAGKCGDGTGEQHMTGKKRSEQRRRTIPLAGRFTPEEAAEVRAKAEAWGAAVSAFIRHATIDASLPRHKVDKEAAARVLTALGDIRAELGKSGSNLNQIAYHLNAGRPGDIMEGSLAAAIAEHGQAIRTLEELRLVCMQVLGFERNRKTPEDD